MEGNCLPLVPQLEPVTTEPLKLMTRLTEALNQRFDDLDEVKEDSEVILILHIRGLKILKQYFYCDCYISQIKVFQGRSESKYTIMNDYALIDEEDVEDDIFDEEIFNSFKSD